MTHEIRSSAARRERSRRSGANRINRRRLLPAIGLIVGTGMASLALAMPQSAAAATASCREIGVGMSPLAYSQTVVARARETFRILSEASAAAKEKHIGTLRASLKDAQSRLEEIGSPPDALMVRNQIRVVLRDLAEGSTRPDERLWIALGRDVDQYLSTAVDVDRHWVRSRFHEARNAMSLGELQAATNTLRGLLAVIGRQFDGFPIDQAYEDVASALRSAQDWPPLWQGVNSGLQSAMAQLNWTVQGEPLPLLHAHYAANEALDACPDDSAAVPGLLLETANALDKVAPALAEQAKALAAEPAPSKAKLMGLAADIGDAIEQAQNRAAGDYASQNEAAATGTRHGKAIVLASGAVAQAGAGGR